MAKLRETLSSLIAPPEYVNHKNDMGFYYPARKNYRREHIRHAADKAVYRLAMAMLVNVALLTLAPKPPPIEIRLLSSDTATHHTDNPKPATSQMREPVPATVFERSKLPIIVWTNSTSK